MHKKIHPARVWCTYARHVAPPSRVLRLLCPRRDSRGDRPRRLRKRGSYLLDMRDFFGCFFAVPKTLRQCRSGQPPWGVPGSLFRTETTNLGFVPFFVANLLPVIFNINAKNYFIGTFIGILQSVFIMSSFASGLSEALFKFEKFPSFLILLALPEIHYPIIGFVAIIILSIVIKKNVLDK